MDFRQNDDEAELLSGLIEDINNFDAFIINPAGRSQTSSVDLKIYSSVINEIGRQDKPVVEVRIENIFKEGKNKPLYGSEGRLGFVGGFGMYSYVLAIQSIDKKLRNK